MFNLDSFLTRFKRGGSGAPAHPPARRASGSPYEGATVGRRLGIWVTTCDAIHSVWYRSADQPAARSRDIIRKDENSAKIEGSHFPGGLIEDRSPIASTESRACLRKWQGSGG